MSAKGRILWVAGLALAALVATALASWLVLPGLVDKGLRSATKRTPYQLTYSRKKFTWPPGILLEEVSLRQKTSGRIVAAVPELSIGLSRSRGSNFPRLLILLEAADVTLKTDGKTAWAEDQAKSFLKNILKNFRRVGLGWNLGRVALEGAADERLALQQVRGRAFAKGLDTFWLTTDGTIVPADGGASKIEGTFGWDVTILRYKDRTVVERQWDGGGLRVAKAGQVVKEPGEKWLVTSRVPWIIIFPIGEVNPHTTMVPDNAKLRSIWEREWPFHLISHGRPSQAN